MRKFQVVAFFFVHFRPREFSTPSFYSMGLFDITPIVFDHTGPSLSQSRFALLPERLGWLNFTLVHASLNVVP